VAAAAHSTQQCGSSTFVVLNMCLIVQESDHAPKRHGLKVKACQQFKLLSSADLMLHNTGQQQLL
jgi:hypothetical protein